MAKKSRKNTQQATPIAESHDYEAELELERKRRTHAAWEILGALIGSGIIEPPELDVTSRKKMVRVYEFVSYAVIQIEGILETACDL